MPNDVGRCGSSCGPDKKRVQKMRPVSSHQREVRQKGLAGVPPGRPGGRVSLCSELTSPQPIVPARNHHSGKISCRPDGLTAPPLFASLATSPSGGGGEGGVRDVLTSAHAPRPNRVLGQNCVRARAGTCSRSVYKVSTGSHAKAIRVRDSTTDDPRRRIPRPRTSLREARLLLREPSGYATTPCCCCCWLHGTIPTHM